MVWAALGQMISVEIVKNIFSVNRSELKRCDVRGLRKLQTFDKHKEMFADYGPCHTLQGHLSLQHCSR